MSTAPVAIDGAAERAAPVRPRVTGDLVAAILITIVVAATVAYVGMVRHALGIDGRAAAMLAVTVFGTAACVAICLSWRRQRDWTRVEHTLATRTGRDPLTGLVDRVGLTERLSKGLGPQRTPTASRPAVLCCDLDRFQRINDTYGHACGDSVIVAAGRRFANVLRAGDTIGRLDGDTFVVICLVGSANEATEIADRLLGTLDNPFAIGGHTFRVTASIGIAVADGSTADPEALMRDADHAMIQAKRDGRERAVRFAVRHASPHERGHDRAAARSARRRPVPTRVPAGRVELRRHDRRRRSPPAVGPPAPGRRSAERVHPAARGVGPHRRGRHMGAARGVPAGIGVDARLP